jgi:hypothetical protein
MSRNAVYSFPQRIAPPPTQNNRSPSADPSVSQSTVCSNGLLARAHYAASHLMCTIAQPHRQPPGRLGVEGGDVLAPCLALRHKSVRSERFSERLMSWHHSPRDHQQAHHLASAKIDPRSTDRSPKTSIPGMRRQNKEEIHNQGRGRVCRIVVCQFSTLPYDAYFPLARRAWPCYTMSVQ